MQNTSFSPNEDGYFGKFGGAFVPDVLLPNLKELQDNYQKIIFSDDFQEEYKALLRDYVGRPSPLYLAPGLSKKHNAQIYLKREDLNHTGAHKINNTIGQILIAKRLNKTKVIAETGAGQHGVATATVCALMGMECMIFMGEKDIERQAPNIFRMKMLGATIVPVTSGSKTLKDAVNAALGYWVENSDSFFLIGSVVGPHPHPDMVGRLQAIISEEIKAQLLEKTGKENPDKVIACVGGGSNAIGAFYNFLDEKEVELIAVEASGKGIDSGQTAATAKLGKPGVLHGSNTLFMQDENNKVVDTYSISAGLDYPGVGPIFAHLLEEKRVSFLNATDEEALAAALELSRLEGIIPALESAHALAGLSKISFKPGEVVVINLSGRGDKDLHTYMNHFDLLSE